MSFFVSDQLKGHIDESDLLELKEENEHSLVLKVCNNHVDVQSIQFQKDINTLTCIIKNKDDITALMTENSVFDLCYGNVKIKSLTGQKTIQNLRNNKL